VGHSPFHVVSIGSNTFVLVLVARYHSVKKAGQLGFPRTTAPVPFVIGLLFLSLALILNHQENTIDGANKEDANLS
jgi:hypothetical protein